jgi:hypothetical protein
MASLSDKHTTPTFKLLLVLVTPTANKKDQKGISPLTID